MIGFHCNFWFKPHATAPLVFSPKERTVEAWIKAGLSVAVVAVSLYVIVSGDQGEAQRQWAIGAIAFILGYYFRRSEPDIPR